jgi:dTDP-4-dehydrorhamnose 3,5-epimerase
MELIELDLPGVYLIKQRNFSDLRGNFVKTFHRTTFLEYGLCGDFKESFFSESKKNVIRGMHFQVPPADHHKLVTIYAGSILDVIVDLRSGENFGKYISVELSREDATAIYIPKGCAHGFLSLTEGSVVNYMTSTEHSPENDRGIRFDSFGFNWPVDNPIMSDRDQAFPGIEEFKGVF